MGALTPSRAPASGTRTLDELVYRRLNWTMHRVAMLGLAMQLLVLAAWFVGADGDGVNPWAREPAAMSLMVPVTASMWYLARQGRLNRRLMYGYVFFFSTWPTVLALGTQAVFPWGAASILVGPPALLWILATVLSGITLERRLPMVMGVWAGAQQLLVFYLAQPSFAAIGDHGWLIQHLGTWHSVVARGLMMVAIGVMVGFVAEFGHKVLAHSLEEERKVTLEVAARASAEAASRAKTAFLATVSHEIRTPLNAILGYAQALLRRAGIDAETAQGLGIIEDSSQHLSAVVDDLLDLARVEADRLELDPTEVHLKSLLDSVVNLLRRRASSKGLTLGLRLDPAAPEWVWADGKRLRQVLLNLVGNAVKFTGTGHVVLLVSQGPEGILFEVEDTGPGVEPSTRDTIFESFQQAEAGKREADGVGLGLAISQRLVDLMGGDLQLRSEYGAGSTFFFTLPLSAAPPGTLPTRSASATGHEGPTIGAASDAVSDEVHAQRLPSGDTLARMSTLARVGNLDAIAALCRQLEREQPSPFATRVRVLADAFEDEALLRVLAAAVDQSEAEVGRPAPNA